MLEPDEEAELARRWRDEQDQEAVRQIVSSHLRLVAKIAMGFRGYGLPVADLISEGNLGLIKAVERFRPHKGSKFSSYASWWIRQSIHRALGEQTHAIRLTPLATSKLAKLRRVAHAMSGEMGREPTDEELADEVGLTEAKVAALKSSAIRPASLDAPIGRDDGETLFGDMISDENAEDPLEHLEEKDARASLSGLLKVLTPREREIVKLRYGLGGGKQRTLEDIGVKFGITRERIRQIQMAALNKLRREMGRQASSAVVP